MPIYWLKMRGFPLTFGLIASFLFLPYFAYSGVDRVPLKAKNRIKNCLGQSLPLWMVAQSPYLKLTAGSVQKKSERWFIIDTGASESYLDPSAWNEPLNCNTEKKVCSPESFYFFEEFQKSKFGIQNYSGIKNTVKQAGLLGTDFLDEYPYTFDFKEKKFYRANPESFCADVDLQRAGLVALSTSGYFSSHFQNLLTRKEVKSLRMGSSSIKLPNIPTVPIQVGKVKAFAQLDTGYNDSKRPLSVNINQAMKSAMDQSGMKLVSVPKKNIKVSTCIKGLTEVLVAYELPKGYALSFMGMDGSRVRSYSKVNLFLKNTPPDAIECGGISTWGIPAAQLGGSFLKDAGMVILNPIAEKVWMPRK